MAVRHRGDRRAAAESAEEPLAHGIAQAGNDSRQQDRQEERADHRDEVGVSMETEPRGGGADPSHGHDGRQVWFLAAAA